MTRLPWHSSREIATEIEGLTDKKEILRRIRNINVSVMRRRIPEWAYRKMGGVYEFNPHYFIAPEPPAQKVKGVSHV